MDKRAEVAIEIFRKKVAIEIFRRWSDGIRFCTHPKEENDACVHANSGHFHCVKDGNGFFADEYIKAIALALEAVRRETLLEAIKIVEEDASWNVSSNSIKKLKQALGKEEGE